VPLSERNGGGCQTRLEIIELRTDEPEIDGMIRGGDRRKPWSICDAEQDGPVQILVGRLPPA